MDNHRTPKVEDCLFYHAMDLPNGEHHAGEWDLRGKFDIYTGHLPIKNKTFLDVGTATGFLSFSAEAAGAAGVLSVDADDHTPITPIPWTENEGKPTDSQPVLERVKNSYWYCHNALGSKAQVLYRDIHGLGDDMGQFDVVIAGCILLHLVNPIGGLMRVARRAREHLIITDLDPYDVEDQPVLLPNFCRNHQRAAWDTMSWWQLPPKAISTFLDVMGFDTLRVERFTVPWKNDGALGSFYSLVAKRR